ncbi:MAG: zf-HC2 domain-containing protein [Planctomycetes bacterium]|nr:zf-HC2 domain-containing protein [Planctomycetota bacterium]
MDCAEVRSRTHEFHEGALPVDEAAAVREHLQACPGCRTAAGRVSALDALLRLGAPVPHPGEDFWAAQRARIAARARHAATPGPRALRRLSGPHPRTLAVALGLAACAMLAIGVGMLQDARLREDAARAAARARELALATTPRSAPPGDAGSQTQATPKGGEATARPPVQSEPTPHETESPSTPAVARDPETGSVDVGTVVPEEEAAPPVGADYAAEAANAVPPASVLPGEEGHVRRLIEELLAAGAADDLAAQVFTLCASATARLAELRTAVLRGNEPMATELAAAYDRLLRTGLLELFPAGAAGATGAHDLARRHEPTLARLERGASGPLRATLRDAVAACRELKRARPRELAWQPRQDRGGAVTTSPWRLVETAGELVSLATSREPDRRVDLFLQAALARAAALVAAPGAKVTRENASSLAAAYEDLLLRGAVAAIARGVASGVDMQSAARRCAAAAEEETTTLRSALAKADAHARAALADALAASERAPDEARAALSAQGAESSGSRDARDAHAPAGAQDSTPRRR